MKTIASEWTEFAKAISPKAPEGQRREMRAAFYAGCSAMFFMLVTQVSDGDEIREADLNMMDGFKREIENFSAALRGQT